MKKIAEIHTLGCRLNIADSALLTARLQRAGYEVTEGADKSGTPSLIILNSCAVTAEAAAKSRRMVRRMRRENPQAKIIVTGCASQSDPASFLEAGADFALGNSGKKFIPDALDEIPELKEKSVPENKVFAEETLSSFPFRSRAFIKIQEGCNNFCTYCIVPHVRGRERSRAFDEAVADCRKALEDGFSEVVLTGVNTCAYNDSGKDLPCLVKALCDIPGDFRIRLSSTEPKMDNFSLIDAMADAGEKVCRFLHLSLQHGSDRILKAMNRRYTCDEYRRFVAAARAKLPGVHVGTDVIVGFPGETNEDFAACLEFVKEMAFANIHIFSYSPRPGTPAALMKGQVPAAVVKERFQQLKQAADESAAAFRDSQIGQEARVIFERSENGFLKGWSDNYLPFSVPENMFPAGKIVRFCAREGFMEKNTPAE